MHNCISISELAEIMQVGHEWVARVERGEDEYTTTHIDALKKHLCLTGLPITPEERAAFKKKMYYWRDLIRNKKLDKARLIQQEVTNIINLEPCDASIVMLCKLIKIQLLLQEDNHATAEMLLATFVQELCRMDDECLYHYYYAKGILVNAQERYEDCLDYFLLAYELAEDNSTILPKEDAWLYYYIALCYTKIEIPHRAVFFWQKAKYACANDESTSFTLQIDRGLAANYIKLNQLKDAKRLLDKCAQVDQSLMNDACIGVTYMYLGCMHKEAKNWVSAIKYLDMALEHLPANTDCYYASMYHKIFCAIQTKSVVAANQQFEHISALGLVGAVWTIYFDALSHYYMIINNMTSYKNDKSVAYIEKIAIPHFISEHDYFLAIEYYTLLEQYYSNLNLTKKSLAMTQAINTLYKRCLLNHDRDD